MIRFNFIANGKVNVNGVIFVGLEVAPNFRT